MRNHSAIIIGSGHNGLVAGAYLAKSGYQVTVFERREDIGGAVCTRDMFGGYKMDVGGSVHCLIHSTPIYNDLSLDSFGLHYIPLDPILSVPFNDGTQFFVHKDLAQTCESIATVSTRDAETYYSFVKRWEAINKAIFELFLQTPSVANMFRTVLMHNFGWKKQRIKLLKYLLSSYGDIINNTFENPKVRAGLMWWAAQSGPPPTERASAELFAWQSMLHITGAYRPVGGSGMLTQALARCIERAGGTVHTNAPVAKILTQSNKAVGIKLENGEEHYATTVVANAHVQTVFNTMLRDWTPPSLKKDINELSVGNGFGMIVRCATDRLPQYRSSSQLNQSITAGIQLLCPSVEYLEHTYGDFIRGIPSTKPAALAMTFSAIDDTLAPADKHILFIWGQYYPYALQNQQQWGDIAQREADKLIQVVEGYAPGTVDAITNMYIQTPLEIERLHAMPKGNVMHIEMTIENMFLFRPLPVLSRYKTPLKNLFLASAGVHPGGGIFGAAGYNCARVILGKR